MSGISNHAWYNISTEYYSRIPAIVSKTWVWQTKYVPSTIRFGGALSVNQPYKYAVWNSTVGKWFIDSGSVARSIQDTVGDTEGSCGYGVPNFQGAYCAYHTFQVINSTSSFKYAYISNPANNTSDWCTKYCSHEAYFGLGTKTYPNERAADTMISLVAHEMVEMLTDPVWAPAATSAWLDQVGCENADMCSWTYGNTTQAANGGKTNLSVGGKQWLVQQNWVLSKNDCGMKL
ncbi:phosphateresponsive 1 family protein [Acanthamoeba castellanii str. Neff]|uniref:Phosphateresponsive 1 family protein n=1 Tax=Acanthamoeba castellanii (strain ATCC 30010 / Neff) TaxID=1257118 RepID=L8HA56_ACACF|nr:phosphateresponsive 1 family protein [Acanthamoeba castellanii str. Neff]ELR21578.1 phosphateresponsive 1 family protein [Acanthamoeba castellanii str. Neff]